MRIANSIAEPTSRTLSHMQARIARESITGSALRQSVTGTIDDARGFFALDFDLAEFAKSARSDFGVAHERTRKALQAHLCRRQRSFEFGRTVKALDLFLRGAVSHFHLREAFALGSIEPLLFLPLDSFTMSELRARTAAEALPAVAIYKLSEADYLAYQRCAAALANQRQELRVWLDDEFWGVQTKASR